jgi:quercetin dioxygenase-like cupin family protein
MRSAFAITGLGAVGIAVGVLSLAAAGNDRQQPPASTAASRPDGTRTPLVLAPSEGERRIRRVMGGALAIIKVDRRNGGEPELMMGYEELPPGQAIQPHRHPSMGEIIFVHRGSGTAELGDRTAAVAPGSTIYLPENTRVTLRNTGTEPLAIAFFFAHQGYEEYLRDTSVPEGQQAAPLTAAELVPIRERHKAHIVFDPPK